MAYRFLLIHVAASVGIVTSLLADEATTVIPHGSVAGADWTLTTLNDASGLETPSEFVFPETAHQVRLYLIDTAVDNTSGWFDSNPILNLAATELIRGSEDPEVSSAFTHGTQVLSAIAGPEMGVARGTQIEVFNYDIYPQGESASSVALLITGVEAAIDHFINHPGTPSVICIANGSEIPATSALLEARIAEAIGRGITVVVAAGNEGTNASSFIPAAYGTMDGVICVGASDQNNQPLPTSNSGSAVDIHAPGLDVSTFDPALAGSGTTTPMTGTSPATAIVTAAVVAELGRQPNLSPAELEALLKERAYSTDESPTVRIVQLTNDFDGDGTVDELERLFGYDPLSADSKPPALSLNRSNGFSSLAFTIDETLLNPSNPTALADGSSWRLLCSTDLVTWTEVDGYTYIGGAAEGKASIQIIDAEVHEVPESPDLSYSGPAGEPYIVLPINDELVLIPADPEQTYQTTLIQPSNPQTRCFYKIEWIPARLSGE